MTLALQLVRFMPDPFIQILSQNKCAAFNYTVDSKRDYELLLLQTSSLPVSAIISNKSTEHDIFNYENFIKRRISNYISYNHHDCIDIDLLTTPILMYHLTPRLPSRTDSKS